MVARQIECSTDLSKLLFVRRRPIPVSDKVMRREMNTFTSCVAIASIGWTAGLSLITYNDELYKWGWAGTGILIGMVAWILLSFVLSWCFTRLWITYVTKLKARSGSSYSDSSGGS